MEFDIGFVDSDKVIHVNKDNIDEFEKRMEKARRWYYDIFSSIMVFWNVDMGRYIILPILVAVIIMAVAYKSRNDSFQKISIAILIFAILMAVVGSHVLWFYSYEVPSVDEKVITVASWQPKAGIDVNENGLMVIDSADDLMMVTTAGEGFLNEENFLFHKFNTQDIYNQLKVNGTYKIKYYGWREGFNSGFPNILTVEEIIDENNSQLNNNFGNSIVYGF